MQPSGHSPLAHRPRSEGRRPGRGSFVAAARRAVKGGLPASGAPEPPLRHPLPPACPSSPLPGLGARLCTFLPWPAGSAVERLRGRRELRGRARGLETPRRLPARGAPPEPGPGGGLRCCGRRPPGCAGCAVPLALPGAEVGDPGPHAVPREAKEDLGSGSAAVGERTRA